MTFESLIASIDVRSTTNVFYFTFSVGIELTVRGETEHGRELLAFGWENYSRSQARLEKQVRVV